MADAEQQTVALEHANRVGLEAARLRHAIRAAGPSGGARLAAEAVLAGSSPMPFGKLLLAIPRVGSVHAEWWLDQAEIAEQARVDSKFVSERRRELLVGQLLAFADRAERWTAA